MLNIYQVPVAQCAQVWPYVEGYIDKCLKYTDDVDLTQVKAFVLTGAWVLVVAADETGRIHGASTVTFVNDPNFRTAIITTMGGKGIISRELFGPYLNLIRALGATRVQAYARDSAARLYERYGLRKKATLMELKI